MAGADLAIWRKCCDFRVIRVVNGVGEVPVFWLFALRRARAGGLRARALWGGIHRQPFTSTAVNFRVSRGSLPTTGFIPLSLLKFRVIFPPLCRQAAPASPRGQTQGLGERKAVALTHPKYLPFHFRIRAPDNRDVVPLLSEGCKHGRDDQSGKAVERAGVAIGIPHTVQDGIFRLNTS